MPEMEGDQVGSWSSKGLVKWVVDMTVRFPSVRKIWAERKSYLAGCFSTSSQAHEAQKQGEDVHEDEGPWPVNNTSLSKACQDDAGTSLVVLEDKFKSLPEELVERILAMVPFPEVGKARVLSKSWLARFSQIDAHDDEEKKRLAISFQKQVRERSINWRRPCPIFFNLWQKRFFAYESASQNWPKMPSLTFFPAVKFDNFYRKPLIGPLITLGQVFYNPNTVILNRDYETAEDFNITFLKLVDGALLLAGSVIRGEDTQRSLELEEPTFQLHVANLLTQTWRKLPQAPPARGYMAFVNLVSQPALEKYKVIMFHSESRYFFAQCYDSKSKSWRRTTGIHISEGLAPPTLLNGVLYMKVGYGWTRLLAFNVEEETFEELELVGVGGKRSKKINLVVCNGQLLMIVQDDDSPVQVLKIDLESREVIEVARGPPAALTFGRRYMTTGCHTDGVTSLFFRLCGHIQKNHGMVVYNMRTDAWHLVAIPETCWLDSTFETNFNPFLSV